MVGFSLLLRCGWKPWVISPVVVKLAFAFPVTVVFAPNSREFLFCLILSYFFILCGEEAKEAVASYHVRWWRVCVCVVVEWKSSMFVCLSVERHVTVTHLRETQLLSEINLRTLAVDCCQWSAAGQKGKRELLRGEGGEGGSMKKKEKQIIAQRCNLRPCHPCWREGWERETTML